MIPDKRHSILFVFLTVVLLVACEPLAPEQTPHIVVVTGETPIATPIMGLTPEAAQDTNTSLVTTPEPSATAVPAATPTPTTAPVVCADSNGQVFESTFYSDIVQSDVPFRIYLPPCFYDTLQRYPYVLLLHGSGYDQTMWTDLGVAQAMDQGVADGTLPPMVLIMPYGGMLSELNDEPDGQSFESLLLDELMPSIESDFCLWGSRQGRAIGGISRGGFWAFSVALRYPDLFSAVGGHSPHFEPDNASPEYNPMNLAGRVNLADYPLRIYMDNGADDYVSENAIRVSETLRENGIQHEYLINPTGTHEMAYWQAHLAEYLSFYGQTWPKDMNALPSCLDPNP